MAKRKKNQQNRATPIKRGESAKKTETIAKDVGKRVNKPAEDADQEDGGWRELIESIAFAFIFPFRCTGACSATVSSKK